MSEAPERIWAFPKNDWFNAGASTYKIKAAGAKDVEYIRADLVEAAVKRALEGAANCLLMFSEPGVALDYSLKDEIEAIRSLASDPAQFIDGGSDE